MFRNEEPQSFNSSTEVIRRMDWEGLVRCKKYLKSFGRKPEEIAWKT
jgi:hypothetical protein